MNGRPLRGFYFITDSGLSENGVLEDVRRALSAGVALVQYREKSLSRDERLSEAKAVMVLCSEAGVPFIVNDDVSLAAEIGAGGVHVGQDDTPVEEARAALGPSAIVGTSVGSPGEARAAEEAGATYVAASPVFETATKPDAPPPVGIAGIRAIRAATGLPLAAIGGLNADNVADATEAGADMICAISASLAGGDVAGNIARLAASAERATGRPG